MNKFTATIGAIIIIAGIVYGVLQYQNIPKRVKVVEEYQFKQDDQVQELAGTVNSFIVEQRTINVGQDKREALMLKLIEKE
ncbi:MAG TPA: hypothetical protein VMV86_04245 [Methanosarcinales archaeon]|nr:hypothetical protein [Methanosarcinales archaeon]